MRAKVAQGAFLSSAFAEFPDIFPPLFVHLVRAGEQSGHLEEVMGDIADLLEREVALRRMISGWTFYPKLVLAFAICLLLFLQPLISAFIFGSPGALASAFRSVVIWGLLFFLAYIIYKVFLPPAYVRAVRDAVKFYIPLVGKVARKLSLARFCLLLARLVEAGVPPQSSLLLAGEGSGDMALKNKAASIIPEVERGRRLSELFERERILPPYLLNMLKVGEESGRLPQALQVVVDYLEGEARLSIQRLAIGGAVAFYILVAIFVGYIYIGTLAKYYMGLMELGE